jgi:hypothetical protein
MEFDIDRLHRWARAAAPMATALAEKAHLNADARLESGSIKRKGDRIFERVQFPSKVM